VPKPVRQHVEDLFLAGLTGEGPVAEVAGFPQTLNEALSALERDPVLSTWLAADLLHAYLSLKRAEMEEAAQLSPTTSTRATRAPISVVQYGLIWPMTRCARSTMSLILGLSRRTASAVNGGVSERGYSALLR
jgi:Glutamine synthetase, catalytic domain